MSFERRILIFFIEISNMMIITCNFRLLFVLQACMFLCIAFTEENKTDVNQNKLKEESKLLEDTCEGFENIERRIKNGKLEKLSKKEQINFKEGVFSVTLNGRKAWKKTDFLLQQLQKLQKQNV